MVDEDPLAKIRKLAASNEPAITLYLVAPITVRKLPDGSIALDAPLGVVGVDEAMIQRIQIESVAAKNLRAALEMIESRPDAPIVLIGPPAN
jgi:hypothetical protein